MAMDRSMFGGQKGIGRGDHEEIIRHSLAVVVEINPRHSPGETMLPETVF